MLSKYTYAAVLLDENGLGVRVFARSATLDEIRAVTPPPGEKAVIVRRGDDNLFVWEDGRWHGCTREAMRLLGEDESMLPTQEG